MTDPVERLRAAGLKVTRGRIAALDALAGSAHLTAEQLQRGIAAAGVPVTLQGVYLSLAQLTERGVTRRIEPAGHAARYELRVGDNHHHLVCTRCDRVVDVDCAAGEAPCLAPADDHGFSVDAAEITFWGVCPDCASAAVADGPTAGGGAAWPTA